ncbi:putative porin [Tamilnaduibacter salinus]|uniref:Putative porin n=1 Tax=Tamilnaduibacter salinus TaxID=1484056 RepID=A0A2U1CU15_9GAMM|nr:porin [Tamilnaduibacter salinus]PVY70332.1 putative porin [Tamilnaduibacter salinus]
MKKTLIASAVAAATFSGSAAAMTAEQLTAKMESMPTFYGNIQLVNRYVDSDASGVTNDALQDNGSTIGVKHESEVAPGVTAFGKIELEGITADDKSTTQPDNNGDDIAVSGLTDLDEAYLGVKGERFGKVWVGSDDSQYESLVGDYGNWVYEVGLNNLYASYTSAEGNLVQYVSPSFGGLTLHGAVQVNGQTDSSGDGNSHPYQLGAKYSVDALTVAFAVDSNDSGVGDSNENSYGVSVAFDVNDNLTLDAYYDMRKGQDSYDNTGDAAEEIELGAENGQDLFGVMGTYTMGANSFRASYAYAEADTSEDESDVITLQAKHNVNGNMYVYAEALQRNNEDVELSEEVNELNVGAVYYF